MTTTKIKTSDEREVKNTVSTQARIIIDGCKVTLKFSAKPDMTAIGEIKQMMLSGLVNVKA